MGLKRILTFFLFIGIASVATSAVAYVSEKLSEAYINRPMGDSDGMSDVVIPQFIVPPSGYQTRRDYSHLDPEHLIAPSILEKAVKYYDYNFEKLTNTNFIKTVQSFTNAIF